MRKGGVVFLSKRRYLELVEKEKHVHDADEISDVLKKIEDVVSSAVTRDTPNNNSDVIAHKIDEIKMILRNISMTAPSLAMTTPPNSKIEIEEITEENIDMEIDDEDIDALLGD